MSVNSRRTQFLLLAVAAFALASCGDAASFCNFDSDCWGDQLCVQEQCSNVCASDEDCRSFENCQAFLRPEESDPVQVCMMEGDNSINSAGGDQCEDNGDCRGLLGNEDAICGVDRRCVIPIPTADERAYAFLIRDTSVAPALDEEEEGEGEREGEEEAAPFKGLELLDVFLTSAEGVIIGYSQTLSYLPAVELGQTAHLRGVAPQLDDTGRCVADVEEAPRTALGGAGGQYLVTFLSPVGKPVEVLSGMRVVVVSVGEGCGADTEEAREYEAFFCVSEEEGVDIGRDCSYSAGGGQPVRHEFEVTEGR